MQGITFAPSQIIKIWQEENYIRRVLSCLMKEWTA
nr:MAG TPA: hypothetical protein [Caudoviricetes sp.]